MKRNVKFSRLIRFASTTALLLPLSTFAADNPNAGLEAMVRSAFADVPAMITIAKCESGFRQFASPGTVLRGGSAGQYVGLFQIDERIHVTAAKAIGADIYSAEGNIAYAKHLLAARGTAPWKGCAPAEAAPAGTSAENPAPAPTPVPAATTGNPLPALTADLLPGTVHPQVRVLQALLNRAKFAVAWSGPGSPGNETAKYGALTLDAVRRFQCASKIVCEGSPSTTGFGRVGPRTRAALNAAVIVTE